MSWYGNYSDATKRLDSLLEKKPTLQELMAHSELIEQLKAFNPKLLDYISSSNDIPKDLVMYLTHPPTPEDSNDRKYRLPLLSIELLET